MSIITKEIKTQQDQDPSYIDTDLQWAWARGYSCGATRPMTDRETEAVARELHVIDCNRAGLFMDIDQAWQQLPQATKAGYLAHARRLHRRATEAAAEPDATEATPKSYELTLTRNDGKTVGIGSIHPTHDQRTVFTLNPAIIQEGDKDITIRILKTALHALTHEKNRP